MEISGKRILVTGGAGFFGTKIVELLREQGAVPVVFDKVVNLDMDITKTIDLQVLEPIDAVIHLAAIAAPRFCDENPEIAFNVNVQGTHNILQAALKLGVKKLVFASTAHVYGISPRYLPTDERHPLWGQDIYTITKLVGENLCQLFWDNHGLPYISLRVYNGYGPGQPPGYFVRDMIGKAKKEKIALSGADITKDFIYVDDIARAYVLALMSEFIGPINIGSGRETRLEYIAKFIADQFNVPFSFSNSAPGTATRMACDNRRASTILGWQHEVALEEGLKRTIAAWR